MSSWPVRKASVLPSGENTGFVPSSLPAIGCACASSRRRTKILRVPLSEAANATTAPSGEIATAGWSSSRSEVPGGVFMSNRITGVSLAARVRQTRPSAPSETSATARVAARIPTGTPRALGRAPLVGRATGAEPGI